VTFTAGKLDLPLVTPALLYGLSLLGVMLILWEAVTYAAKLARHDRPKSYQGPSTVPRPSQQSFGAPKDGARWRWTTSLRMRRENTSRARPRISGVPAQIR
jgi:hypothetical protein